MGQGDLGRDPTKDMSDVREDFYPDVIDALCDACGEPVLLEDAFKIKGEVLHPECAEVWKCPYCGEFVKNEDERCPSCGEPQPEKGKG